MAKTSTKVTPKKSVQSTLTQRGNTHGDFTNSSQVSQDLKAIIRKSLNWETLSADKKDSLDMITQKIARICTGNANEPDHWHDIAGYATLAEDRCAPTN